MNTKKYLSYHMDFSNVYTGKLDKYGGLPTHLPPVWPTEERWGDRLTFLCQLYCDDLKLSLPNTLCLQIYQLVIDGEEGSDPCIIQVPLGAKLNTQKEGISHPYIQEGDIIFEEVWEEVNEQSVQDEFESENGIYLLKNKLKGWFNIGEITTDKFLGLIMDGNVFSPFNWGCGYNLVIYLDKGGKVVWDFI